MSPFAAPSFELTPTDHPHIVRTEGVCGGRPRLIHTRIPVSTIAELFQRGESAEEIAATYPHVNPEAIDDAISYYLDHREEIDAEIEANTLEAVLKRTGGILQNGVIRFRDTHGSPLAPLRSLF